MNEPANRSPGSQVRANRQEVPFILSDFQGRFRFIRFDYRFNYRFRFKYMFRFNYRSNSRSLTMTSREGPFQDKSNRFTRFTSRFTRFEPNRKPANRAGSNRFK